MQIMKSTETIPILIISCYIIVLFLFFGTCLFYYSYLYLLVKYFLNLFSVLCYRIRISSSRIKVLRNAVYLLFDTFETPETVYINIHEDRQ